MAKKANVETVFKPGECDDISTYRRWVLPH